MSSISFSPRRQILGLLALTAPALTLLAQPTDNVVETRYGTDYPWASEINWANVQTTAAVANDSGDDLATVQAEINALSGSGGGVLYFPAGTYNFSDDLVIADGVVIRGATPSSVNAKLDDASYDPPTNFEFPKFAYVDLTPAQIASTSGAARENLVDAAFKSIRAANVTSASNLGIVYIDVNRATIKVTGTEEGLAGNTSAIGSADQLDLGNENIVILGNRVNNAVELDPNVPQGFQNAWQVWTNRFTYRIKVYALRNALVASNRIGDFHWQKYVQENSAFDTLAEDVFFTRGTDALDSGAYLDTAAQAGAGVSDTTFYDNSILPMYFSEGYGIMINRLESPFDTGIQKFPITTPQYYYPGMTARDNWVYTTTRVKIQVAGDQPVIKGNVIRDQAFKPRTMSEAGLSWLTVGRAQDNIAIEATGVNPIIEDNNWVINPTQMGQPGEYSDWGVGIRYLGGTATPSRLFGFTVRNNVGTTDIPEGEKHSGLDITGIVWAEDVLIEGNQFLNGGDITFSVADANPFTKVNIKILNNTVREGTDGLNGNINIRSGVLVGDRNEVTGNTVDNALSYYDMTVEGGFNQPSDPTSTFYVANNTVGTENAEPFSGISPTIPSENFVELRPTLTLVNASEVTDLSALTPGSTVTVQLEVDLEGGVVPITEALFWDGVISSSDPTVTEVVLTDGNSDGIFTGEWTVPTEIDSLRPFFRVKKAEQSVTLNTSPFGEAAQFIDEAWLFPPVSGEAAPPAPAIVLRPALINNDTQITITFDDVSGTQYKLQTSQDLVSWNDVGGTTITGDGGEHVYTLPVDTSRKFFRLCTL
jgi:hypothetical protein